MKIHLFILCGAERHFWIAPELAHSLLVWASDPRLHPANGGSYTYQAAYGHKTSQQARNWAADEFIAGDADYMVMIDNDTIPVNPDRREVISLGDLCALDLPIVGVPVPTMNNDDWLLNAYRLQPNGAYRSMSHTEWHEPSPDLIHPATGCHLVDAVGFGMVIIKREVITRMAQCGLVLHSNYHDRSMWEPTAKRPYPPIFMRSRDADGSTLYGEDLLFCGRAHAALQIQSYAAPLHYQCGHAHTIDYARIPAVRFASNDPADLAKRLGIEPDKMPEFTGWEIEPELAIWLSDWVRDAPGWPMVIELGCGFSTRVLVAAMQAKGKGRLLTLEHEMKYLESIEDGLDTHYHASILTTIDQDGFYRSQPMTSDNDLLLIDGPPGQYNGRRLALDKLGYALRLGATVVLDDADRPDEKAAWKSWVESGQIINPFRVGRAAVGTWAGKSSS